MGERQNERLSLHLFGTPEVRQAGRVLSFPTRKTLALLIYLATEDSAQSRERIAALLWPESDEERSRGALRSTLGLLRATLRSAAGQAETLLVGERDRLEFVPGDAWESDLQLLRAAFDLARVPGAPLTGARIAQLQAALDRYRGDFLAGFSISDAPEFDDWVAAQRELWHGRADLVCTRLSQALLDGGDLIAAREVIARWLALAPLNEEVHRRLITLAILGGDRAAGLRAYEACRALLRAELQAEPAPETTALAQRLRTLPAASARRPGDEGHRSPASAPVPLVGRLAEHAALVEAYRAVARDGPILVTVEGEPGIGKTRLVGDFLRWATAQGADVLHGRAYETGRLPYQPLIDALRARLARDSGPEPLLAPLWLGELQRLLPELAERHPAPPPPEAADEATARGRLFEAVARFGQALAGQTTAIVFLDDLHWADAASLELLAYACRRWTAAKTPVLMIATVRSDELRADPALTGWLASQERDLALRRLPLGPLAPPDTARLARALAEARPAAADPEPFSDAALAAFAGWLQAETGGHPLYAIETVKLALERGDTPWHQPAGQPDPAEPTGLAPGMQAVIRARLARLDAPAGQLLVAGAVLGTACDFPTLCQVAEIDEGRGLPALDLLLARQLLREAGAQYRFSHDKIREVAYAEASAARRGLLHRRAIAVLERAGAPAATLARHALAAGLPQRAFGWSITAGDDALRVFAVRDALAHYERAWSLAPAFPQSTPADRDHLAAQLGRACELTDQYARARTIYAGMLATARERRDPAGEAAALHRLATVASHELDFDAQATYLHQALDLAEREGDTVALADITWNLGRLHFFRAEFAPGRAYAERAVQLARDLGLREETARGLNFLALSEVTQGRWDETLAHGAEARAIYRELGNRALEADCLAAMAAAHLRLGRTAEGIATARAAYNLGREIENRWGQADAAKELALGLVEQGEYAEALAVALDAVTVARDANYPPLLILTLMILGAIHRRLGAFETARSLHREALALDEPRTILAFSEQLLGELCADAAALGDWAEAHTWARQALALRDDANLYAGLTRWCETEALLQAGQEAEAATDLQRFARRIGANRRYRLPYLRAAATLAIWRGARAEAIGHLREAAVLADTLALPGEAWEIAAALGRALRDCGDESAARQEFTRAGQIVRVLVDKLPDAGLRTTFLARARAQEVGPT